MNTTAKTTARAKAPGIMATMMSVMRKELRDIGRDRRTLAMTLLLAPLLYPLLIVGMGHLAESRARTQLEGVLEVPVAGADRAPNLVQYLATQSIKAIDAPDDLEAAVIRQDFDVGIVIGEDYGEAWSEGRSAPVEILADSTRRNAEIPVARVRTALQAYRSQVGTLRLMVRGIDPAVVAPLAVGNRDLASAQAKQGRLLAVMLPYLLILSSFLGGAYLIIDATAGERERQSLEPLLATPSARGAIVSGKIAAACMLGLTTLLLTLLAFKASAMMAPGVAKMADVSFMAIARMLFILLPMLLIGTSLLTFLAASAKSMKEAQSHTVWLMLMPMVPTFVLMVNPVKSELWQFTVPFLAQNQLLLKVIRGEWISPQVWAVYLAAGLGLAALLWFLAVNRYRQEKLAIAG